MSTVITDDRTFAGTQGNHFTHDLPPVILVELAQDECAVIGELNKQFSCSEFNSVRAIFGWSRLRWHDDSYDRESGTRSGRL